MFTVKVTNKYLISEERGCKVFFNLVNDPDSESNGSFVVIMPEFEARAYTVGEEYTIGVGV